MSLLRTFARALDALTFFDTDVGGPIGRQYLDAGTCDTVGNDLIADLVTLNLQVIANLERCHYQGIWSIETRRASGTIRRWALWIVVRSRDTHREATECY